MTQGLCEQAAPDGTTISSHVCDVSDETQVLAFRDAVAQAHGDHLHLLFNNAGIGGGQSFVTGDRAEWERTFGVCWWGVYYCTRAFLPLLVAAPEACIVNTSSVNGFWATLGNRTPHTAYSTAKFAVKGFSEALITDLRVHAPHVTVALIMPGHVGTPIMDNTRAVLGKPPYMEMSAAEITESRELLRGMGMPADDWGADLVRQAMQAAAAEFEHGAPLSAAAAATAILEGVRAGRWRILVGDDAEALDDMVRHDPENAYDRAFLHALHAAGHFGPRRG